MNQPTALHTNMDIDPLSSYEYHPYDNYPQLPPVNSINPAPYPYHVKLEQPTYYQQNTTNHNANIAMPTQETKAPINTIESKTEINADTKTDVKDVKPVITKKRKDKNGQKSTYCSEKIKDASFPFYGCSVCNISYSALHELDQHVHIHKDRMTSYRLRLRNQFKKKQIKKEKKKLKKMIKIKKENENDLQIEIKPEDGYIGNEKASDFVNGNELNNDCNVNGIESKHSEIISNSSINNGTNDSENSVNNGVNSIESSINNGMHTESSMNNGMNNESSINNGTDKNENKMDNKDKMDDTEFNNLEKIYKCFACQKQFTLSYYLKLHVRSHTDEKPYTCAVCGQSFITASKLGRHNKRIHLAARFQCRICFKIFARFELLTAHFDKIHAEDKLEGEPYDYNAILPYLKELEEQLREQAETKSKPTEIWPEGLPETPVTEATSGQVKEEQPETQETPALPAKVEVLVVPQEWEEDVKIKQEVVMSDDDPGDDTPLCELKSDVKSDVKDEGDDDGVSDDDYFPSNTWAATPKPTSPPPSPIRNKKSSKTCEICHKKVSSASYMRVHMRTHTGEKPFKCYTCGRGFITKSKMHRHVLTHDEDEKAVKNENDVKKEHADDNPDDGETPDDNTKTTKKKSKMKSKLSTKLKNGEEKPRKKHQKRPHACEYCHQKFLHLNMLEVHKKCHEGETLVHRCQYCLEEAIDEAALREHEATHTGPKPYLCTVCGRGYKKRETMVYHRKLHSPDKEFTCDICSKRFNAACKLHKHVLTHRADKFVLRYECPVCAHMFHTKYHVHMHLNTHQREGLILEENRNEILAMVLQNARKIPKQPDAPNLTEIIPSDERSRVCNICGEVFHHFYYLEEHLKSHGSRIAVEDIEKEEIKKYICQICNKGFKLHYYLKLHSFTHSKEKPFICQQCGKGFITRGKLKRHLETHTGLKKYQCHICYKFFTRPSYLRIHIRTIHGTQDYNFRLDKGYGVAFGMSSLNNGSDVSQNSV